MHKRYIPGLIVPAVVLVVMTTTAALAAPVHNMRITESGLRDKAVTYTAQRKAAVPYSCSGTAGTSSRKCWLYLQEVDGTYPLLFNSKGDVVVQLAVGSKVLVTCWYYGNPPSNLGLVGDGVQDHVTEESPTNYEAGHVPDAYVNEGGEYPYDSPYDIVEC
jgi:hypothetical protein